VYLLSALRHPDIWPVGDRALQVGVGDLLGRPAPPGPDEMEAIGERWRPFRSVAARLIWHDYLRRRGRDETDVAGLGPVTDGGPPGGLAFRSVCPAPARLRNPPVLPPPESWAVTARRLHRPAVSPGACWGEQSSPSWPRASASSARPAAPRRPWRWPMPPRPRRRPPPTRRRPRRPLLPPPSRRLPLPSRTPPPPPARRPPPFPPCASRATGWGSWSSGRRWKTRSMRSAPGWGAPTPTRDGCRPAALSAPAPAAWSGWCGGRACACSSATGRPSSARTNGTSSPTASRRSTPTP